MRKYFYLFCFILISFTANSQTPTFKVWDHRYGGSGKDIPRLLLQTLDQGFLLGGSSQSDSSFDRIDTSRGKADYWIVRTDSVGNILWNKAYGGSESDFVSCGLVLPDSGFLIGGYSSSGANGDRTQPNNDTVTVSSDYWVIRIDKNGNKIWDKAFGGSRFEDLGGLVLLDDGSFILGGTTYSDSTGDMTHRSYGSFDYWLVKIDSLGNKIWDRNYGGSNLDLLGNIGKTTDGKIIVAGHSGSPASPSKSQSNINSSSDYWVLKLDTSGFQLWDKTIGGGSGDLSVNMTILPGDNILVGGLSLSDSGYDKTERNHGTLTNNADYWVLKLDSGGTKIWDKSFGGDDKEDELGNLTVFNDGYLMAATSYSDVSGDKSQNNVFEEEQSWVLAFDTLGNRLWDKTLRAIVHEEFCAGFQTRDSCFVFLSYVDTDGGDVSEVRNSDRDYWLVKYCLSDLPYANFSSEARAFCSNACIDFVNLSEKANSYQWIFLGADPLTTTDETPQNICYSTPGKFNVTLIATNDKGSDTLTFPDYITVYPPILATPVTQSNDTLFSAPGYFSYQWYRDLVPINNATNYFYVVLNSGNFSVLITDTNGCSVKVNKDGIINSIDNVQEKEQILSVIYSSGQLKINSSIESEILIEVTDVLGKKIQNQKVFLQKGMNSISLSNENLSDGNYIINISNNKFSKKFKVYIH